MGEELVKTVVWYSVQNGGDGSAYPQWFLTEEDTQYDQDSMSEGWGETCNGSVQTYEGSDIHRSAVVNSRLLNINRDVADMSEEEVVAYFEGNNLPYHLNYRDGKYVAYKGSGSIYRISVYSSGGVEVDHW